MLFQPTDTLSVGLYGFDVLKMDVVEDPMISIEKMSNTELNESYTKEVIDFINESTREFTNRKIKFYNALKESTSEYVVLESFADFFSGVKDIVKKFIDFLKRIVDKFIATLMRFISSENYIKRNKDKIAKIKDVDFSFNGYDFSFSRAVPPATAITSFNAAPFDELTNYANGNTTASGSNAIDASAVRSIINSMELDKKYDLFRGEVLGMANTPVYISEFNNKLFEVYRSGDSDTKRIDVTSTELHRALDRFLNYKNSVSEVKHHRDETIKAYEQVQQQVENIVKRNGDLDSKAFLSRLPNDISSPEAITFATDAVGSGAKMSAELMTMLDMYVKIKCDQIKEYSDIHLLAFGAKLDAMNDCFKQDRNIIYTAIQKQPLTSKEGD